MPKDRNPSPSSRQTALRISLIYAAVSAFWILVSDWILFLITEGSDAAGIYQTAKGWFFVSITSILLYFLINTAFAAQKRSQRDLSRSEERYRFLFEKNPHPMWIYDLENLHFLAVNEAAMEHYGYSSDEFLRMTIKDIRPREDIPPLLKKVDEAATRFNLSGIWRHYKKDGTLISVEIITQPLDFDGRKAKLVLAHDVTEELQATANLKRLNRTLTVLSRCNETLVRATNESDLLHGVCENLVALGGYLLAWVGSPEIHGSIRIVAQSGEDRGFLGAIKLSWQDDALDLGPTARTMRDGRVVLSRSISTDERFSHIRSMIDDLGISAAISLPLFDDREMIAALTIYSWEEEAFDPEEVKLLQELADDLSYGIASIRTAAARNAAEEALRLRTRAIEASSNGIMICKAETGKLPILYVNPAFERITGYSSGDVMGRGPEFLAGEDRDQKGLVEINESLRLGPTTGAVVKNYRKDGGPFWNEFSVAPVKDASGTVTHYVSILNDVTERKNYEEQLEHQANHDSLTNLANRNLLADRITQNLFHAARGQRLVAVILLDLDRFKIINDSLGHDLGDELLQLVAQRLNACVRPGDTVARLGGDEFIVAMADVAEMDDVALIAKKIRDICVRPFTLGGRELFITASIGISLYPRDGQDHETLVRHADVAMYRAKEDGGNTFRFFTEQMNVDVLKVLELEADLRRALERGEFLLHYQPQLDLVSGRITGCEALLRWHHPERGLIPPGDFIPLAEETGLIVPLGDWVLNTACMQNRRWQDEGLPPVTLATNLSTRQFRESDLLEKVRIVLQDTGLEPAWLSLEVTESMVMHDPAGAVEIMRSFHEMGLGISLDDFGTGYSSLNYLRRFPVDCLKIDRSFIADVTTDPSGAAVATSVIAIAHSLGLKAIAEGVETREQLEFLKGCECDGYQGFYFSRPLPPDEFASLLRKQQFEKEH